jgi:hypothetical protein
MNNGNRFLIPEKQTEINMEWIQQIKFRIDMADWLVADFIIRSTFLLLFCCLIPYISSLWTVNIDRCSIWKAFD